MQAIQAFLTIAIEVTAIVGFGGIALHAIWSRHRRWMATYCPPIAPQLELRKPQPESVESEPLVAVSDPWILEIDEPVLTTTTKPACQQIKPMFLLSPATPVEASFDRLTKTRLNAIAKELKIPRYSRMDRLDLISAISKHPSSLTLTA